MPNDALELRPQIRIDDPIARMPTPATYAALKKCVQKVLLHGQQRIEVLKVMTYWQTGRYIHEHVLLQADSAGYGERVIERLAQDLELGCRLLERTIQFYRCFSEMPSARTPLTWAHYRALITVKDDQKRKELAKLAEEKHWSSRELEIRLRNLHWDERSDEDDGPRIVLPPPKLGTFFTYRVIRPETIHSHANELLIDLGFSVTLETDRFSGIAFKPDTFIGSQKDARGKYSLRRAKDAVWDDLFTYQAFVERVIDGDTLKVEIDLGFNTRVRDILRLKAIDCPEMDTPEGKAARKLVEDTLAGVDAVIIKTTKTMSKEKYGRYLADVFIPKPGGTGMARRLAAGEMIYLNQLLLDRDLAVKVRV